MRTVLGIPHAAHLHDRAAGMARLRAQLGDWTKDPSTYFEVTDKLPHPDWSRQLWEKGRDLTVGDPTAQFVTIQDDVVIPENFAQILQALYTIWPDRIVSLFNVHPISRELARAGGKMYRSRAFVLGIGYSIPGSLMAEFCDFRARNEKAARMRSEDSFVALWAVETGRDIYHTLPSIVEHDVSMPSTWAADNHGNRTARVSFRDYSPAELAREDFWVHGGVPRLITDHLGPRCWLCVDPKRPEIGEQAFMTFEPSGVAIGARCWAKCGEFLGADVARRMAGG